MSIKAASAVADLEPCQSVREHWSKHFGFDPFIRAKSVLAQRWMFRVGWAIMVVVSVFFLWVSVAGFKPPGFGLWACLVFVLPASIGLYYLQRRDRAPVEDFYRRLSGVAEQLEIDIHYMVKLEIQTLKDIASSNITVLAKLAEREKLNRVTGAGVYQRTYNDQVLYDAFCRFSDAHLTGISLVDYINRARSLVELDRPAAI